MSILKPASFSKQDYEQAKKHIEEVKLVHITIRDPKTMGSLTTSGIMNELNVKKLYKFMMEKWL